MTNYYNKDLYKILHIGFEATQDDIKASYKKLVKIYHPDASGPYASAELFKEIQEAYEVLSDIEKRKKYDVLRGYYREKIKKDFETSKNKYDEFVKKAKDNIPNKKENFSKSINDALDSLFNSSSSKKQKKEIKNPVDGEDINMNISISLFEALNGTNRKVNILHTQPCPNCQGRMFINGAVCSMCNGTGQTSIQKKINVKIPKGVKQGSKIRVKNEGNKGIYGGKNGDLYLIVNIEKNSFYEIEGFNILCNLPISVTEAVFGADIKLNLPDGKVNLKIPAMTSSGQKLRIAGMGVENKSKTKRGDLIITVYIKLPSMFTNKELELYSSLKEISSYNAREEMQKDEK